MRRFPIVGVHTTHRRLLPGVLAVMAAFAGAALGPWCRPRRGVWSRSAARAPRRL